MLELLEELLELEVAIDDTKVELMNDDTKLEAIELELEELEVVDAALELELE